MGTLVEQLEFEFEEIPYGLIEFFEHLKELGLDI